ncbi:MAG: hypothetical protein P4L36_12695 [Holophaga sp.]|nr:hypothetical protein [Holophaga sp.]
MNVNLSLLLRVGIVPLVLLAAPLRAQILDYQTVANDSAADWKVTFSKDGLAALPKDPNDCASLQIMDASGRRQIGVLKNKNLSITLAKGQTYQFRFHMPESVTAAIDRAKREKKKVLVDKKKFPGGIVQMGLCFENSKKKRFEFWETALPETGVMAAGFNFKDDDVPAEFTMEDEQNISITKPAPSDN